MCVHENRCMQFSFIALGTCDTLIDVKTLWMFLYYEYYISHMETNISPRLENF